MILVLVGLAVGFALGWYVRGRHDSAPRLVIPVGVPTEQPQQKE